MLPSEVLSKAQGELLNYKQTGMSVMELPIKSAEFENLLDSCEQKCRKLLEIPANYKVLFLQGGSTTQYAAIPINLLQLWRSLRRVFCDALCLVPTRHLS